MSALDRLRAKHLAATSDKPAPRQESMIKTTTCAGENTKTMASLLNKVKTTTSKADKVTEQIEKRKADGLYTAPSGIENLGIDGNAIMEQLQELDHAVLGKTPEIGLFTLRIRKNLEQYPELTHILTDEQLGIICSGVLHEANVSTAPKSAAAKTAAAKKKVENLSLDTNIDDI